MPYTPDQILVSENTKNLFQDTAEYICSYASNCVKHNGIFNIALAGGSTPRALYETLCSPACLNTMPWQQSHFYFGDERMVPHDHIDSNYLMAKQALFDCAPVPEENIHPVPTHCETAVTCATQYAQEISRLEQFDLILLGMGNDGHTASLFPGTDILLEQEKNVAAVFIEKMNSWRISLTYPAINKAACVIVLVKGDDKRSMVKEVLYGKHQSQYPVTGVRPAGKLIWRLDRAAHPDTM